LTGDHLLYIIGRMLKAQNMLDNNIIVSTVMSNLGFVKKLEEENIEYVQSGVGDIQVFEAMKKYGAGLGGEESGHIIFSKYLSSGDGVLSAIMILKALEFFGRPLSDLAGEIELYPKVLINFEVSRKPPVEDLENVCDLIAEIERQLAGRGRVLVRYSGTEPKCRVMVESRDYKTAEDCANKIAEEIKNSIN
jgi:phosphoglucosamine mutase